MATQEVKLTAYITDQSKLPRGSPNSPVTLKGIFSELKERAEKSGGALSFSFVDPASLTDAEQAKLSEERGFMPSVLSMEVFIGFMVSSRLVQNLNRFSSYKKI